jgi:Ca2+ transporting ATPase
LNSVVGVSQETSAEKAIAALQEYSANEAKVIRNGTLKRIKADDLVPGDIVSVAVGDRIPADCRLLSIQSNSFNVDQSILTGESESVSKDVRAIKDADAVKQDQINMLFSGTTVVTGHATALVVQTGSKTAIGDIHESITSQISQPTPLKEKLNDFGDVLAKVITGICILVWLINIGNFSDPAHGGFAKGAIYYLKVCVISSVTLALLTESRSRFPLVSLLSQKASRSLSPHVWHWVPAKWPLGTLLSGVSPLLKPSEAAVSSALIKPVL